METTKELFESGAMLIRDYKGHEQMLMNEGTFIAIIEKERKGWMGLIKIKKEQLTELTLKLEGHHPEGHNVTNLQYQQLRDKYFELEKKYNELKKL